MIASLFEFRNRLMLSYIGGSYMEASVVVVVGCKMVGTSSMREKAESDHTREKNKG